MVLDEALNQEDCIVWVITNVYSMHTQVYNLRIENE